MTEDTEESVPRYDHSFIVTIQTDDAVPFDYLCRLAGLLDGADLAALTRFVGTIDYAPDRA